MANANYEEYKQIMRSVPCAKCQAEAGKPCNPASSGTVHEVRRREVIKLGRWTPEIADQWLKEGKLAGLPLEVFHFYG